QGIVEAVTVGVGQVGAGADVVFFEIGEAVAVAVGQDELTVGHGAVVHRQKTGEGIDASRLGELKVLKGDGVAIVKLREGAASLGRHGLKQGSRLLPQRYAIAQPRQEGIAIVAVVYGVAGGKH